MIKVNAIKCGECEDVVYSRAKDDFRSCSCGLVDVFGGLTHFRYESRSENFKLVKLDIDSTPSELRNDWYWGEDLYGLILGRQENKKESKIYIF